MYFCCDPAAIEHLKEDPKMGAVIDRIGPIQRAVDPDLFSSVVHHIIGQQISTKAQATIWQRMRDAFGSVNPDSVLSAGTGSPAGFWNLLPQGAVHHGILRAKSAAGPLIWRVSGRKQMRRPSHSLLP